MSDIEALRADVLAALGEETADGGVDLLGRVCQACIRLLPVDGAAVTVVTKMGQRELAYATDAVSLALAELQFSLGEGPSFEAYASGDAVLVPDLGGELPPAWPIFAVEAAAQPVEALFSFPMHLGPVRVATLDAHRASPGPLGVEDLATARRMAGIAALALSALSANADRWLDGAGDRMAGAGMRHQQVAQATGMVIAQLGLSPEAALARIRAHAFAHRRPLLAIAADIVSRHVNLRAGTDHGPQ